MAFRNGFSKWLFKGFFRLPEQSQTFFLAPSDEPRYCSALPTMEADVCRMLQMMKLTRDSLQTREDVLKFYKDEPSKLKHHKWPAPSILWLLLFNTYNSKWTLPVEVWKQIYVSVLQSDVVEAERVWVAVYPEEKESYITLVWAATCVKECQAILASHNPANSLDYGSDSFFTFKVDTTTHYFLCNEMGRIGDFKPNKHVSPMLRFKFYSDNMMLGRPMRDEVYGPVAVCLAEEFESEDDEDDEYETFVDVQCYGELHEVLGEWCELWWKRRLRQLYEVQ